MTASAASIRMGAAEMRCWPESQPTSVCGRASMHGWQRIGILPIPAEHCMRRSAATSALALHNSFEFISKEEHLEYWKTQFDFSARLRARGAAGPGTDHARGYAR